MNIIGVKYPNINAKLKGMYAKRITKQDLEDLIKQNNLKNAVVLLKTKCNIFNNSEEDIDRLQIESLLEEDQINDILKILKLLNKKDQEILNTFLLKYEIICVKSIFRKLFSDDKTDDIVIQNVNRWTKTLFEDIKGIETVENFEEFIEAIKRMKYNKIFKNYREQENVNIFEIENKIDKLYFETLYDKVKNEKNLRKIIGSEIDLLNISWIFRTKKYYNFEEKRIKQILINRNYHLKSKIIDKAIETTSFEELQSVMEKTIYRNIFTEESELENDIDKYLYLINKKIFKEDIMSIGYIFAYINLINYENNDIINTIEGIRYSMEKQEILKKLIR